MQRNGSLSQRVKLHYLLPAQRFEMFFSTTVRGMPVMFTLSPVCLNLNRWHGSLNSVTSAHCKVI